MSLNDLSHWFGGDIKLGSGGDLLPIGKEVKGQQRIIRRLLTNPATPDAPADYIFHPEYGAGLPKKVGTLQDNAKIKALIQSQIALEASVAKLPAPEILVRSIMGGVSVRIIYTDSDTKNAQTLSFNVTK